MLATRLIIWMLVVTTFSLGLFPPETRAMLAPPTLAGGENLSGEARLADLQKVQTVLESKMVRQRLGEIGLTAEEIDARLAKLSDAQLHDLATQLESLTPGGDALGVVVVLLVVAVLVVLFVYLVQRV